MDLEQDLTLESSFSPATPETPENQENATELPTEAVVETAEAVTPTDRQATPTEPQQEDAVEDVQPTTATESDEEEDEEALVPYNDDDSEEKADEIGIGDSYDSYGREIIPACFENYLRMSKNSVKLVYSKLKNEILSHVGLKQRFFGKAELFKNGSERLFRMEIGDGALLFYSTAYKGAPKKDRLTEKRYAETPLKIEVKTADDLKQALALIEKIFTQKEIGKKEVYAPVAYCARYPLVRQAVVEGNELTPPVEYEYDDDRDYAPVANELTMDIIHELMGEDFRIEDKQGEERLQGLRQQATTIKGAVALSEPIVYFYDAVLNADSSVNYLHVSQVLNDKFLGKMLPQQFFAPAEGSDRIERLNIACIEQMVEDIRNNEKITFQTEISTRMVIKPDALKRLLKHIAVLEDKASRMILSFEAPLIEAVGKVAINGISEIAKLGVKIMLTNTENASFRALTELPLDYVLLDYRYYKDGSAPHLVHLDLVTNYVKSVGIVSVGTNVNDSKEAKIFLSHGVECIQGAAASEKKRSIYETFKKPNKLPLIAK